MKFGDEPNFVRSVIWLAARRTANEKKIRAGDLFGFTNGLTFPLEAPKQTERLEYA